MLRASSRAKAISLLKEDTLGFSRCQVLNLPYRTRLSAVGLCL